MSDIVKIAVIDDCRAAREFFTFAIRKIKTHVPLQVEDIPFVKNPAKLLEYGVVFIDFAMAGKSGVDILHEMLEASNWDYDRLPCVFFITGFPANIMKSKLEEANIDSARLRYVVLEKPVTIETVHQRLKETCPIVFGDAELGYKTPTAKEALKKSVETIFRAMTPIPANLIVFCSLLLLLISCSGPGKVAQDLWVIDQSTTSIKNIVTHHREDMTEQEYQTLRGLYEAWQQIIAALKARGCGLEALGNKTCNLDVLTIALFHRELKERYLAAKQIALKYWDRLNPEERIALQEMQSRAKELDELLTQFEADPKSVKTLRIIKAMSLLAIATKRALPIILGSI